MLHIVLLILKIIGIVLGVLIGLVLLVLCLALFVPVHYQIKAERTEQEGGPPLEALVKITWLLHFINIKIMYPSEIYLKVRVLFITLFRLPPKRKKGKKTKKADKEKEQETKAGQEEQTADYIKETAGHIKKTDPAAEKMESREKDADARDQSGRKQHRQEQKFSVKEKLIKIYKFFQNIWYTITGICDKIKSIWENIEYYLNILKSDTFQQAFSLCKEELFSILSYMKPRKFNADLIIGMDDPASTGQILSFYGILYPFIGNYVTVEGDFENKRMEGTVSIKGKMKLFTFLKTAVRVYFNKDIRKLLKLFKKEDV